MPIGGGNSGIGGNTVSSGGSGSGFSGTFDGGISSGSGSSGGSGGSSGSNNFGINIKSNKKENNISIDSITVNNFYYYENDIPIEVAFGPCVLNWSYRTINQSIKQVWYEVRIGTHKINWGNSNYMPDIYRQPFTRNSSSFWMLKEKYISRGNIYYGQIRLKDNTDNVSDWKVFSFKINQQPKVINAEITPSFPGINSDLYLEYDITEDSSVFVRWYKNGEHQSYFDNYEFISKEYMRYSDVWFAEITPYDNIEKGSLFITDSVSVTKESPVAENLEILPKYATDQDILEASYSILNDNIELFNDKSIINWYINGFIIDNASGFKSVKLATKPGDEVFFTIQPSDGIFSGEVLSSPVRIIKDAGFRVYQVRIDGQSDNINVSTVNPTIEWNIIEPFKRFVKYTKIDIGTAPGGNNVGSFVLTDFEEKFVIPDNYISRGIDYYATVYVSDSSDIFENGNTTHFRVEGNKWKDSVNNSNGWSVLVSLKIDGESYQYVSIADGYRFAQMRFYENKIELLSSGGIVASANIDLSTFSNILISGKNNDIKIYNNNSLLIDASSLFTLYSSAKYIEIGSNDKSDATGYIKSVFYTTKMCYYPDSSDSFEEIVFQKYIQFNGESIDSLCDYDGDVIVSVNPSNPKDSGFVYQISEKTKPTIASAENIDLYKSKLYCAEISPDQKNAVFGYAGGASIFENYNITSFDVLSSFEDARDPLLDFWEKTQTTKNESSKFENSGLIINTTFSNIGSIDNIQIENVIYNTPAISIKYKYQENFPYDYYVYIENGFVVIKAVSYGDLESSSVEAARFEMSKYSLEDLCSLINNEESYDINKYVYAEVVNSLNNYSSSLLRSVSSSYIYPNVIMYADVDKNIFDLDPYSYVDGGKCFYSHRKPGTKWFDKVSNIKGWTVDFDITVFSVEDGISHSNTDEPSGLGLYVNDGTYYEIINFLPQEIVLKQSKKSVIYDNTSKTYFRIIGKEKSINIYAKKENEKHYSLILSSNFVSASTSQGNAGRPSLCKSSNGNIHAVWHDDGNSGKRQIMYAYYDEISQLWSDPVSIVSDSFGSSNPDICIDSNDRMYVVYESNQTDYSDIHVVSYYNNEWSDATVLTNSIGHSVNPKVTSDDLNNVHVVWEDYRLGISQIFYCYRSSSDGQWFSEAEGHEDIQVTSVSSGAKHPSVFSYGLNVYISWTFLRQDGTSGVFLSYYNSGSKSWFSSGQDGFDVQVSESSSLRADYPDVICDKKGRVFVVYHDIYEHNYQIFGRRYNSILTMSSDVKQLTTGEYDSKFASASLHEDTGDIYVVFEKNQDRFVNPYVPYIEEQDFYEKLSSVYILKYNSLYQIWESSNQYSVRSGISYGGFDVRIQTSDNRISKRPCSSRKHSSAMHILYESEMSRSNDSNLLNNELFACINDAVFDYSFSPNYYISINDEYSLNPYVQKDFNLNSSLYRKEIRFGDFSDHTNINCSISKIAYYLSDSVSPFNVNLISSATVNMPITNVYSLKVGNNGDCYIGSEYGLFYYNKNNNEIFVFDNDDCGIKDVSIYDIIVDKNGHMILATDEGIFITNDYLYFWKITNSNIPSIINCLALTYDNFLYAGTNSGIYVIYLSDIYKNIKITNENYNIKRTIAIDEVSVLNETSGMVDNNINVIKIDANNVCWIGTNKGLVRYNPLNKNIFTFNHKNGLSSNKVLDIAIRNTAIRYIASTSGVDKMVGINIEKLDFDDINAPVASISTPAKAESEIPNFNNARSILWKDPNILYICSLNDIYQITFTDDDFNTEKTQIEKYSPDIYAMINISTVQNDDLSIFKLVGVEDIEIDDNVFYEVYLNGHIITNGYSFSPKYQIIKFNYPLNKSDIVKVNVRLDVKKISSLKQNRAYQEAEGYKTIRSGKLCSDGHNIFMALRGDINNVQINDLHEDLPFDKITLDTVPPKGKLSFIEQINRNSIRLGIDQIDPYTPFDATSGVDRMIVSNFSNFTYDGDNKIESVPFNVIYDHDLGIIFENATKQMSFEDINGYRIGLWNKSDNNSVILAGTSGGSYIYGYDTDSKEWKLIVSLDSDVNSSVNFITTYNNLIIIGTGNDYGVGKIYSSSDGINFSVLASVPDKHAYCYAVLNGVLYIGGGGEKGFLTSYSNNKFNTIFDSIGHGVYGLVSSDGVLFAATGNEGRVYRLDPNNLTQQIMHVDNDNKFISISSGTVNDVKYVFAGTYGSGKILRHKISNSAFIHSFKTVSKPVYDMKEINGKVYAAIGNTLFVLDGIWQSKYVNDTDILSISEGPDGNVWFCSASAIYKVEKTSSIRNVYLKMIDRAGNETQLYLDKNETKLDTNLYVSVNIDDLTGFVNKNRIIEVNDVGDTVFSYNGNDRFYSAEKIDEEKGVYYSEIFNGSNNLVRWDTLSLDVFVPENTDVKLYVRTGITRDEVIDANFLTEISYEDSPADISYLSGQYLQFKVVMSSKVRGTSPSLRKVVIKSISSDSTHFFTTNFVLPSRVSAGIMTSQKIVPMAADIVFGINTTNSVDFADYQIIEDNRVFTTEDSQDGNNLRIGIRLITPSYGESVGSDFGEYGPYNTLLMSNSIDWSLTNSSEESLDYDFRLTFYDDSISDVVVYSVSTTDSFAGFSFNGESFSDNSVSINSGQEGFFSFTPTGDNPLKCNTYYFVKIEYNDGSGWKIFADTYSFIKSCGVSFIDNIDFTFNNTEQSNYFNFRIRFYTDEERTNLFYTAYSGNDQYGWLADSSQLESSGSYVLNGDTVQASYTPDLNLFDSTQVYYISIDAFNGESFINHSNSFTFKAQNIDENIYCGPYRNVPVVKNFAIMFELDSGQFVKMNIS